MAFPDSRRQTFCLTEAAIYFGIGRTETKYLLLNARVSTKNIPIKTCAALAERRSFLARQKRSLWHKRSDISAWTRSTQNHNID